MNHYLLGTISLLISFCAGSFPIRSAAEEPLRPMPQLGWAGTGVASPDGSLFATRSAQYGTHMIKLVSKQGDLLWTIPLLPPMDLVFSPDEKWLAACGADEGLLLNLKACELRYFPALSGELVAFTPDSQKVLVVRRWTYGLPRGKEAADQGLFVYDLDARHTGRFPVEMEVPLRLEVLPDGKTVRVSGAHGKTGAIIPSPMGKAVETSHLDTGKTERDWGPATTNWRWTSPPDVSGNRQLPSDGGRIRLFAQPKGFLWSEATGLCVHYGTGSPKGNEVVWDIRQGRFLRAFGQEVDIFSISGFLGTDTILTTTHSRLRREPPTSLLNVRTGQITSTTVVGWPSSPGPDGKSFFVTVQETSKKGEPVRRRLELYHLPLNEPIYTESVVGHILSFAWSRDGQYFACASDKGPLPVRVFSDAKGKFEEISPADAARHRAPPVRMVSVANGKFEEISLADAVAKHVSAKPYSRIGIKALDLDDSGQWLAAGMGGVEFGLVAIANRKTGQVETVLDGFPIWVNALRFVDSDRLLTGTWHGRVQLWDLRQHKSLWTTETGRELVRFGYVPGGPYVVCGHHGQSGTVLQLETGEVHYRTSRLWSGGNRVPDDWIQPQLIARGTYGMEMDSESMQLRLTDLAAGLTALTFCALPDGQWIIYTPDGDWDGSERVHDWVKFCDGLKPVSPADADRRHRRDRIEAALKQAFP